MSIQDIGTGQPNRAAALPLRTAKPRRAPRVLLIEPSIRPVGVQLLQNAVEVGFAPDGREETLIGHLASGAFDAVITRVEKMTRRVI
jgi:hypothetical protein